jgi:hypothetical protein
MSAGWIKIHRKLQHSEIFKDPDLLRLWMYSLMKASHCKREIVFDGEKVTLEAGQFITGRQSLTDDFNEGVPPKKRVQDRTLWNWVKKLEKLGNITVENASSRRYSIITILKWSEYQEDEPQKDEPKEEKKKKDPVTPPEVKAEEDNEDMSDFLEAAESKELAPVKEEKTKKGKRVYTKEDIEFKLAGWLYKRMLDNNPNAKKPNPQKWSDVIRLMIERDKRKPEEIKAVIDWSQDSDFWMSNILSTEKLRKQYDTLFMQMKKDKDKATRLAAGGGSRLNSGSSKSERKNDLLREMMEKEALPHGKEGNNTAFRLN